MNINDIKLGETYQYYWYNSSGQLQHSPVKVLRINQKSIRVLGLMDLEFRVDPKELDNRQVEAF